MKNIFITIIFLFVTHFIFGQINFDDFEASLKLNNIAIGDINKKQYDSAITNLLEAIRLDSTNRNAHINLCLSYYQKNEFNLMYLYLEKAKQIFLEDDEIFYFTGNALQKLNNMDEAIENYNQAIIFSKVNGEDYPLVYAYYLNRGICFFYQEKYELALEDFSYALSLNDNNSAVYANRGNAYYLLGRHQEACSDWKKAKELGELEVVPYIIKNCDN